MKCRTCGRDTNTAVTGTICERCWETATRTDLELVASPSVTDDVIMWRRAANHDELGPALARRLAWVEDLDTLAGLAANPKTPEQILELLRQHPTAVVARLAVRDRPAFLNEGPGEIDGPAPTHASAGPTGADLSSNDDLDGTPEAKQGVQRWIPLGIVGASFLLLVVLVIALTGEGAGDAAVSTTTTSTAAVTTTTVAPTTTTTEPPPIVLVGGFLPPPTGSLSEHFGEVVRVGDTLTAPKLPVRLTGEATWQWQLCSKPANQEATACEDIDGEADETLTVAKGAKPGMKIRVRTTLTPEGSDRDLVMSSRQVEVLKK